MAAVRMGSPACASNARPLGCTLIWNEVSALVMTVGILGVVFKQANRPILPSNQNPLGALPARFRRQRLLIIGCGDVGLRVARSLGPGGPRPRVLALTSTPARVPLLRAAGVTPLVGNLD